MPTAVRNYSSSPTQRCTPPSLAAETRFCSIRNCCWNSERKFPESMPSIQSSGPIKKNSASGLMRVDHAAARSHGKSAPKHHPWNVVHACELAREVLPLVEGQLAAGMRPSLLTPAGFGLPSAFLESGKRTEAAQVSLLQMWNHVRDWRRLLNDSAAETSSEIIHAHS